MFCLNLVNNFISQDIIAPVVILSKSIEKCRHMLFSLLFIGSYLIHSSSISCYWQTFQIFFIHSNRHTEHLEIDKYALRSHILTFSMRIVKKTKIKMGFGLSYVIVICRTRKNDKNSLEICICIDFRWISSVVYSRPTEICRRSIVTRNSINVIAVRQDAFNISVQLHFTKN